MVIPWTGFPLKTLLDQVEPLGTAKYVAFETLYDPKQMQSSFSAGIDFPYVEGLRLDEAMHPLTILATGLYGKADAESERCADPARRAVEVWLQEHQVDREDHAHGFRAADDVEHRRP